MKMAYYENKFDEYCREIESEIVNTNFKNLL